MATTATTSTNAKAIDGQSAVIDSDKQLSTDNKELTDNKDKLLIDDKDKLLTEMKTLMNSTLTDDNKETIRRFLELMKKCNRDIVEEKKYSHISFLDNMNVDELSKDPVIDKVLKMFIPANGYDYSVYHKYTSTSSYKNGQQFDSVQINGFKSTTFMESFTFDVTGGEDVRFVIEFIASTRAMFIRYDHSLLNYVVQSRDDGICFRYSYCKLNGHLCQISLNENDQHVISFEKLDDNEMKVKTINHNNNCGHLIQKCISDLYNNKQFIDIFRLAPTYIKTM
jgi:hypothetical protein